MTAMVREMIASPEGREMTRSQLRMVLPVQYPDLGKALGLSPEEVEKFYDLLASQQMDLAVDQIDLLGGGAPDPADFQEAQRRSQAKQQANEAELSAMLGNKYPQWQEYQSTLTVRQQVSQLQAALSPAGSSLNDAQRQQLITALAAEQKRITQENNSSPATPGRTQQEMMEQELQRLAETNRRLVDAASGHLNSQQLESYRRMLEQRERLQRTVMGAMGASQ
jgi:hypothetical protein